MRIWIVPFLITAQLTGGSSSPATYGQLGGPSLFERLPNELLGVIHSHLGFEDFANVENLTGGLRHRFKLLHLPAIQECVQKLSSLLYSPTSLSDIELKQLVQSWYRLANLETSDQIDNSVSSRWSEILQELNPQPSPPLMYSADDGTTEVMVDKITNQEREAIRLAYRKYLKKNLEEPLLFNVKNRVLVDMSQLTQEQFARNFPFVSLADTWPMDKLGSLLVQLFDYNCHKGMREGLRLLNPRRFDAIFPGLGDPRPTQQVEVHYAVVQRLILTIMWRLFRTNRWEDLRVFYHYMRKGLNTLMPEQFKTHELAMEWARFGIMLGAITGNPDLISVFDSHLEWREFVWKGPSHLQLRTWMVQCLAQLEYQKTAKYLSAHWSLSEENAESTADKQPLGGQCTKYLYNYSVLYLREGSADLGQYVPRTRLWDTEHQGYAFMTVPSAALPPYDSEQLARDRQDLARDRAEPASMGLAGWLTAWWLNL
ncbi:hypothetical protein BJ085DRAFT_29471 [Dimargaris cristalligena]|uniref:F-box domain-containing protein n=1 Tax=Dimargaris cristalligena TaxID=215637 RepID=A0A4P9ZL19_9FUNG|nr:hypothetical protein BJ085DRAFT_29471 [Dimargaris cristalligena]|eukprot:RKP33795.1 hypothetical protein BJ085DRAFT_29471 [Dimargaris cristalligena]